MVEDDSQELPIGASIALGIMLFITQTKKQRVVGIDTAEEEEAERNIRDVMVWRLLRPMEWKDHGNRNIFVQRLWETACRTCESVAIEIDGNHPNCQVLRAVRARLPFFQNPFSHWQKFNSTALHS